MDVKESSIVSALDDSEFFILLASPDAARSEWVGREVAHWLDSCSPERVLIVIDNEDLHAFKQLLMLTVGLVAAGTSTETKGRVIVKAAPSPLPELRTVIAQQHIPDVFDRYWQAKN